MADKRFLHELLEEDQEPFHLKRYIASRRLQLVNVNHAPPETIRIRKPVAAEDIGSKFRSNFCFHSIQRSPDVRNDDFQSPSPTSACKSPVFLLRVPPRTAALLVEAAMRIQKQQQSNRRMQVGTLGFGIFGAFVKRLKNRKLRKNKFGDQILGRNEIRLNDRYNLGDLTCDQSEEEEEVTDHCFAAGGHTPELRFPAKQQKQANPQTKNSNNLQEEKQRCSPVSVLDSIFDDNEHDVGEPEGNADHSSSSYANIQRVKEQLLSRLRRFEKLAELNPVELGKDFIESISDEGDEEYQSIEGSCSSCREEDIDLEVLNLSSLQHNSNKVFFGQKEVRKRICKNFNASEELGFIDIFHFDEDWEKFSDEVKEVAKEVELAILGVLREELIDH